MSTIFLLEDDPVIGKAVQLQLELENYKVEWVQTLADAKRQSAECKADLYLLDINLPDGSGMEFCNWLRAQDQKNPVIFLTARTDEESVVQGFDQGANDYVRKPFSQRELIARIRNQLADNKATLELVRFAGLTLIKNQQVLKNGEALINLNRREFEILTTFFEHPETIVTREQLIERLASGEEIFDRTVDSHISHIRSKLTKNGVTMVKINSVYGQGYRLEKAV
ncbi:Phosphate regulon transcriptional regulatory protein PhoB [Bdellovibrio bacteriovorus]|uniref:response regulator transcription factor n=1 Tax=Bdellovibrio bacteriovorus TaxID=959 RepID=UPI00045BE1AA|nr:response regulator transcription factor [Bdellovibrio bacteriovorus]AHZ86652.1 two-component response regulator [Bdellovibrio bacteriovorus]BEV67093.1 Phosphate regulon transcriptional regulatory protein PhoB [Bdellovibrio bacteriovorus]